MKIYDKWRELKTDPKDINFKKIKLLRMMSFPHCGNDVIECEIELDNKIMSSFIKIERSKMADFETEANHLKILKDNNYYDKMPNVIEDGNINEKKYLVLEKIKGSRLSDIFLEVNDQEIKKDYLIKYGKELALIHNINYDSFSEAKKRPINDCPNTKKHEKIDETILLYIDYLINNKPKINYNTFIHGDFHYANVLWTDKKISGVLDWEYSGKGFKEQDIAWACVLRPNQLFMDNISDIKHFLQGYNLVGSFDKEKFKWCLINGYCHFYLMNKEEIKYRKKIKNLLLEINKNQLFLNLYKV